MSIVTDKLHTFDIGDWVCPKIDSRRGSFLDEDCDDYTQGIVIDIKKTRIHVAWIGVARAQLYHDRASHRICALYNGSLMCPTSCGGYTPVDIQSVRACAGVVYADIIPVSKKSSKYRRTDLEQVIVCPEIISFGEMLLNKIDQLTEGCSQLKRKTAPTALDRARAITEDAFVLTDEWHKLMVVEAHDTYYADLVE